MLIKNENNTWNEPLYTQQTQMITNHIVSKINNVKLFSNNLTKIIEESYGKTNSVESTIDDLRDSGLFHVDTPVPKEVAYFYVIDHECEYRLYAYDDENINRKNAVGTESCDSLVHESKEGVILTQNYASTSTFNFVNTFGRSLDLDDDGRIDLVLGVAINWDNVAGEVKNMVFFDDVQYMLKDNSDVIVMDVTQSSFQSMKKQAKEQSVYDVDKEKQLLDPNAIANKYVPREGDKEMQLDSKVSAYDGTDPLLNWFLITRSNP